jgi:hypothetical protein
MFKRSLLLFSRRNQRSETGCELGLKMQVLVNDATGPPLMFVCGMDNQPGSHFNPLMVLFCPNRTSRSQSEIIVIFGVQPLPLVTWTEAETAKDSDDTTSSISTAGDVLQKYLELASHITGCV